MLTKFYNQPFKAPKILIIYKIKANLLPQTPKIQQKMMQDYQQNPSNQNMRRDLGKDQDLQLAIDHNYQIQDKDLHDKVLFAVQGLGSVRTINQGDKYIQAYIKGAHCQQSIKDLVKFIRNDVPDNPKVKLILSQYNIVQTDLIQLLLLQVEDKKLSFWIIALLALITSKPSEQLNPDEKQKLYRALREYKRSFVKHQCLTILTVHIADYFRTQVKQKAHYQLLQFIILLLRNLLQIPDSKGQDQQALHNHFLATLIRQQMFNPLLYLIQYERGQIMDKIDIPLLQILYYTFTCFDPELIFKSNDKNKQYFKLANSAKTLRGNLPIRHSRFMPNFIEKSDVGVKRITHNLNKKTQPIQNQRKIPKRTAQLKKVERIELEYFAQNFMELEFQTSDNQTRQNITKKIGQVIFQLSQEFLQVELPRLSELVFSQVYRENAKISTQNVIQYLLLCNWAIKMTRSKYLKQKAEAKNHVQAEQVQFDLASIAHIMQTAHFQLIYKTLFRQATRQKKKDFKINMFNAALKLFDSYLNVINDISMSFRPSDRNNANVLMANMFRHDIARIFKIGFLQITHQGILKTLICVCHKFYKLLSRYSNGKVLTIQTNKLLKRKNKKKLKGQDEQQDMKDFISSDSEQDSDSQRSYKQGQQLSQKKQKAKKPHKSNKLQKQKQPQNQQPMFQQRRFNEISEFAIIAEYDIITKYLIFLKDQRILGNKDDFNESIFFYFQQICNLLRGQWLFYQAQTLVVFQQILSLSNQLVAKKNKLYVEIIKFVRNVCKGFIKLMQKNKLALIQSLFHYPNLSMKQKILKNYDDGEYEAAQEMEQNMFVDKDDDE